MSRRHKETDIQATQPHMTEPAADCRQQITDNYDASHIQVLEGLESVRKRPSMYIGDISIKGLHHIVSDVVDQVLDTTLEDYCKNVKVLIDTDYITHYEKSSHRIVDLLSGCGGLDKSFGSGKTSLVSALALLCRDSIRDQKKQDNIDAIISGPPCQPFSELDEDDYPSPFEDDTPRGRGRPVVEQLCSKFRDAAIWPMAKTIFRKIYNYSIQKATNLAQYLVCFLCSLFRIHDTEEVYGRVGHFHRLIKEHISQKMMPSLRNLQTRVRWLKDKTKAFFRNKKEEAEENLHKAWEALEEKIFGHMVVLAPQFAY